MKLNRQQVLLSLLVIIAAVQVGDWGLNTLIQGPLQERRAKTSQLEKDIRTREKQLADLRAAGGRVAFYHFRCFVDFFGTQCCIGMVFSAKKDVLKTKKPDESGFRPAFLC